AAARSARALRRHERKRRGTRRGRRFATIFHGSEERVRKTLTAEESRMRTLVIAVSMCGLLSLSVQAQNTDIESLGGLLFNFSNPGARSLALGGAFIGLADDASGAETIPAGLTVLRKPEFSLEV